MIRLPSLAALLLLTACTPDPAPPPAEPAGSTATPPANASATPAPVAATSAPVSAAPVLAVEGEGLRLFNPASGGARPLPFGTAREAIMTALGGRGAAESGTQSECGAGPLDYAAWPDGLKLYFQQGKFGGWALDGRAAGKVTTASGIGPGSSRSELEAAYAVKVAPTTLGTEFTAGALSGLLDGPGPSASVDAMWAGVSCNFR